MDELPEATEMTVDQIIAELDRTDQDGPPEKAIRAARECRAEMIPQLSEAIHAACEALRGGAPVEEIGNAPCLAFYLLAEFDAREGLPAILEAISLPDEAPFELFGDALTEHLAGVLAALARDTPEVIDQIIANPQIHEFVRGQAAEVYRYWVRDGLFTRARRGTVARSTPTRAQTRRLLRHELSRRGTHLPGSPRGVGRNRDRVSTQPRG